jgi:hypothetical protein
MSLDYMAFSDIENRLAEMLEDDMKLISNSINSSTNSSSANSSSSSPNSASYYSSYEEQLSFNTQFLEDFLSLGGEGTSTTGGSNANGAVAVGDCYELACIPPFVPYTDSNQDLFDSSVSCSPNSLTSSSAYFSSSSAASSSSTPDDEHHEMINTNSLINCCSSSNSHNMQNYSNNEPIIRTLLNSKLDMVQHQHQHQQQFSNNISSNASSIKIKNIDSSIHSVERQQQQHHQVKRFKSEPYYEEIGNNSPNQQRAAVANTTTTLYKSEAFIPMTPTTTSDSSGMFTTKHLSMKPFLPNLKIINRPPANINMMVKVNGDSSSSEENNGGSGGVGMKTVIHYTKVFNGNTNADERKQLRTAAASSFEATAKPTSNSSSDNNKTGEIRLPNMLVDGKVNIILFAMDHVFRGHKFN